MKINVITYRLICCVTVILLISCRATTFSHSFDNGRYIDFQNGSWAVASIAGYGLEIDERAEAQTYITEGLRSLTGKPVGYVGDVFEHIMGAKRDAISFYLDRIHEKTSYDYIVITTTSIEKDGEYQVSGFGRDSDRYVTVAVVTMEVYDLKTKELIYHQEIRSRNSKPADTSNLFEMFRPRLTISGMLKKSIKKGVKKMKKYGYVN